MALPMFLRIKELTSVVEVLKTGRRQLFGINDRADWLTAERGRRNVLRDVWVPSKPVLHLALALDAQMDNLKIKTSSLVGLLGGDGLQCIVDPAENYWRRFIVSNPGIFHIDDDATLVVTTNSTATNTNIHTLNVK